MKHAVKTLAAKSSAEQSRDHMRELCVERLLQLAKANNKTLHDLSLMLGRNAAYVQQFVKHGCPYEFVLEDRVRLATILNCSLDDVTVDKKSNWLFRDSAKKIHTKPFDLLAGLGLIPMVRASRENPGVIDFNNQAEGQNISVPTILLGVDGAYATVMPDDVMSPVIRKGAVVYVNPVRDAEAGQEVIVKLKNGTGLIRTLTARTRHTALVCQYSPAEEQSIPMSEIEAIHFVVATTRTSLT